VTSNPSSVPFFWPFSQFSHLTVLTMCERSENNAQINETRANYKHVQKKCSKILNSIPSITLLLHPEDKIDFFVSHLTLLIG
jgi:hypothetical protein